MSSDHFSDRLFKVVVLLDRVEQLRLQVQLLVKLFSGSNATFCP